MSDEDKQAALMEHQTKTDSATPESDAGWTYVTGPRWLLEGPGAGEALAAYESVTMKQMASGDVIAIAAPTHWRQFQNRPIPETNTQIAQRRQILAACARMIVLELPGWERCADLTKELEHARQDGITIDHITLADIKLGRDATSNLLRRLPVADQTEPRGPGIKVRKHTRYEAVIETSLGKMSFDLLTNKAPTTVGNLIHLAQQSFYDGTQIHLVVQDHTIRGGCPKGDGTGTAGYFITPENTLKQMEKGDLAMTGNPEGDSCQWFIVTKDSLETSEAFSVFGKIRDGQDTLERINSTEVEDWEDERPMRPKETVQVTTLRVDAIEELNWERDEPPAATGAKGATNNATKRSGTARKAK